MENFIVSARKYRPQTFDTVVGQQAITNTLKNAIRNNQLAQAFLFCGPRGVGKTTCARILAKTINCENITPTGEACDKCPSCISFNESASFNITELDGASNNSVDEIRNLVDKVRIPPQSGKYKVYIIDEVHMLSASAFNAFLKTLEEPPAYAKFILATTEKHKILPTILSRCQIFDFRRITVDDIVGHLKFVASHENIEAEEKALNVIAQKADGAMRDALSIFDQLVSFAGNKLTYETVLNNLNVLDYEYFFRITDCIHAGDIPSTLLIINEIIDKGFEGSHFMIGFGEHLRNLLVCKDPATIKLLETVPAVRERYLEQAAHCSSDFLIRLLDINNRCDLNYKISNNKRLHLELALMQMCLIQGQNNQVPENPAAKQAPVKASNQVKKSEPQQASHIVIPPKVKESKPFPGTISIKQTREKKEQKSSENPSSAEASQSIKQMAEPFTQEQLEEAWGEFTESVHQDLPHLYSTLKKYQPLLKNESMIEFCVDNKLLEEELHQKQNELLDFIRKRLKNTSIWLQIVVPVIPKENKPYTSRDKFSRMVEKNPDLLDLREQFGLDFE
ncbi:MAG: DNA polymerase III subunit gamma/tau [Bacteroidota bacterium]|nr:DNA polymerase III subunit gamma/tau [Bacteroidota bacterium]